MKGSRDEMSAELRIGLVGPEHTIVPLMASLYYRCPDPYAVRMAFHVGTDEPVEWTLARDLLAAALHSREGIGDVQAWPSVVSCDPAAVEGAAAGDTILNIAMTSPFGAARFEVSGRAIAEFLQRTYMLVPAGQEPGYLDFDAELTELLSEALPTRGCRGRAVGPAVGMSGGLGQGSPKGAVREERPVARIDVLVNRPVGRLDRLVFGSFAEHLGRCIYGGIFDEGSPLAGPAGFRTDVLTAVRDLGVTNVRWPGGNFVSGYHWKDGIGPAGARPRRPELAWHSEESNRFGTDEFMAWCQTAGVEPVLCLNMGTGTLDEALAWVEYCNGTGDTYWANRRRANGHAGPYGVRFWGLGNEMYGEWQIGQRSAADYVTTARQWAKALKRLDPGIRLVSCGQTGVDDWDREVIDGLARYVDMHSIHLYTGSPDYWSNVLAPHFAERALEIAGALIDRARYVQQIEHEVSVAYDEWNVWYRTEDGQLEERYSLSDALAVATYLNVFVRRCHIVRMANLAQLVNVIAPIVTSPDGMFLQGSYHPFALMAEASHEVAVDTVVDSGTHPHQDQPGGRWSYRVAGLGPFQLLDVAATRDAEARRLTISVVNRDPERAITTQVNLLGGEATGTMAVHQVRGDKPDAVNSFTQREAVSANKTEQAVRGDRLDVVFPPRSFTVLAVTMA